MREFIINQLQIFAPSALLVENESHFHHGHAGSNDSGESHFKIYIVSPEFLGKSQVVRHRMVYSAISKGFTSTLHAVKIKALSPDEIS